RTPTRGHARYCFRTARRAPRTPGRCSRLIRVRKRAVWTKTLPVRALLGGECAPAALFVLVILVKVLLLLLRLLFRVHLSVSLLDQVFRFAAHDLRQDAGPPGGGLIFSLPLDRGIQPTVGFLNLTKLHVGQRQEQLLSRPVEIVDGRLLRHVNPLQRGLPLAQTVEGGALY